MRFKKTLISISAIGILVLCLFCFASCGFGEKTIYYWYDADGALLYEERVKEGKEPTSQRLPADTEKWDYIEWRDGANTTEKHAHRIPKESYFAGNVFQIVVQDLGETPTGTGSAFVFNSEGWFITNAHVMKDAHYAKAIFNIPNSEIGESFTYLSINKGSYYHLEKDVYIGKIDNYESIASHYKDIPIDETYEIGDKTYSVGYPLSSVELKINEGEVTENWSDLYEKLYSGNTYICSSSYIAPGSSGGILTNDDLEVIGITTLGWNGDNDEFISGASISAFNFAPLLQNTNDRELTTLQNRFHSDEKVFIAAFKDSIQEEKEGLCERITLKDGTVAYTAKIDGEQSLGNGTNALCSLELTIAANGWLSCTIEMFFENESRFIATLCGYYDSKDELDNFEYDFYADFLSGEYYTVKSKDINYSSTITLTLNNYTTNSNSGTVTTDQINYAKTWFNYLYTALTESFAEYK